MYHPASGSDALALNGWAARSGKVAPEAYCSPVCTRGRTRRICAILVDLPALILA